MHFVFKFVNFYKYYGTVLVEIYRIGLYPKITENLVIHSALNVICVYIAETPTFP
jgi:hypothetical protein